MRFGKCAMVVASLLVLSPFAKAARADDTKSEAIAAVASAIIPGLGQAYCQQYGKAAAFFIGEGVLDAVGIGRGGGLLAVASLVHLYDIYDADQSAQQYNIEHRGGGKKAFLGSLLMPDPNKPQIRFSARSHGKLAQPLYGLSYGLHF